MTLDEAVQVFGRGFSFTRSFTKPFEFVQEGPLLVMRDALPRERRTRVDEILAVSLPAVKTAAAIGEYNPHRFLLCTINGMEDNPKSVKSDYKEQGFRALRSEPFFVWDIRDVSISEPAFDVRQISNLEGAELVKQAEGKRQIRPRDLAESDPTLVLFAAWEDGVPVGWVKSIRTHPHAAWVSNLRVAHTHRRRGIGSALMQAMLRHDQERGVTHSVLLASSTGALLYPSLGYKQIGLLQMFSPIRELWT